MKTQIMTSFYLASRAHPADIFNWTEHVFENFGGIARLLSH